MRQNAHIRYHCHPCDMRYRKALFGFHAALVFAVAMILGVFIAAMVALW